MLKKYQLQEKFIFRKLILNLADYQRNNSLFMQNKITYLKNASHKKKIIFRQLVVSFADMW